MGFVPVGVISSQVVVNLNLQCDFIRSLLKSDLTGKAIIGKQFLLAGSDITKDRTKLHCKSKFFTV